jgi:DNA replication protein DnaC|tara:strand:- start:399 stop:968 length:570 start_codon:yes stop_codon:yes gene_type:complete
MIPKAKLKLPEYYKQNNPNILNRIMKDMGEGNPFHYLFIGTVGCGKTELARAIYSSYEPGYWESIKIRRFYRSYLYYLSMNLNDKYQSIRDIEKQFRSKSIVVDDFGDERPSTEAAHDYIANMIEERYDYCILAQNRDHCQTVITTNLKGEEILKFYGSRVLDRIEELFTIMEFKSHSFRREKKERIIG